MSSQFRTIQEILEERGYSIENPPPPYIPENPDPPENPLPPPNHAELPKRPPTKILPKKGAQNSTYLDEIGAALRNNPLQHLQQHSPRLEQITGTIIAWDTEDRTAYGKEQKYLILTFDGSDYSSEPDWYDSSNPHIDIRYSSHRSSGFVAFVQSASQMLGYSAADFNLDLLLGETVTLARVDHSWEANDRLRANHPDGRFHAKVWKMVMVEQK